MNTDRRVCEEYKFSDTLWYCEKQTQVGLNIKAINKTKIQKTEKAIRVNIRHGFFLFFVQYTRIFRKTT